MQIQCYQDRYILFTPDQLVLSFIGSHELKPLRLAIIGGDDVFGASIVPTRTLIII
jgi:hypothetical protein